MTNVMQTRDERSTKFLYRARLCIFPFVFVFIWFSGDARAQLLEYHQALIISKIQQCAHEGKEAVLSATELPTCEEYFQGHKKIAKEIPVEIKPDETCKKDNDLRRLPRDAVKRIAATQNEDSKPDHLPAPTGIRILGALFCERLDLVGLDLQYSLVLDFSLFKFGIEARNFRTHADLSIDNSLIFTDFGMLRASLGGAFFASKSYIEGLRILDSEINGSMLVTDSLIVEAAVDGLKLSGEMRFSGSALSYLVIQFSKIGGMLNLSMTEARCAYLFKKNDIGEVFAANFGFGVITSIDAKNENARFDWSRQQIDHIGKVFERPDVQQTLRASDDCKEPSDVPVRELDLRGRRLQSEFVLFDSNVSSSLCMQSFKRLSYSPDAMLQEPKLPTTITLNYTNVGNYIIMSFSSRTEEQKKLSRGPTKDTKMTFQAVGLETRSLIIDFEDPGAPDRKWLDGLQFDRAYATSEKGIDCPYQKLAIERTNQPTGRPGWRQTGYLNEGNINDEKGLRKPTLDNIEKWLSNNYALTIQPFTAFIGALDKSGDDTLQLRVARARKDLELQRGLGPAFEQSAGTSNIQYAQTSRDSISQFFYIGSLRFWGWLADFGYRPLKAWWTIPVIMLISFIFFWVCIGIVGFKPEKKSKIVPIGILFLFDRLIPLYNIRQEHYQIETFYRRLRRIRRSKKHDKMASARGPQTEKISYLWSHFPVVEADDRRVRWAERYLDVMKLVGVGLAVFVAAVVNALVIK